MQWEPPPSPAQPHPCMHACTASARLNHRRLANTEPGRAAHDGGPTAPALCWPRGLFRVDVLLELYIISEQLGRWREGTETVQRLRQFGVGM